MNIKQLNKSLDEMKSALSEEKAMPKVQAVAEILNAVIKGKFRGKPGDLVDSFEADFDFIGGNEDNVAKLILMLAKEIK